jgi:hypothetical protein
MGFLFDRPLGGGDSFEALVRDRLSALDRDPICPGGKTRLGALDRSQLFAQFIRQTRVELALVQLGRQIAWIHVVRRLAGVLTLQVTQRPFDPGALGGKQLAGSLWIHQATLPNRRTPVPGTPAPGRRDRLNRGGDRGWRCRGDVAMSFGAFSGQSE